MDLKRKVILLVIYFVSVVVGLFALMVSWVILNDFLKDEKLSGTIAVIIGVGIMVLLGYVPRKYILRKE